MLYLLIMWTLAGPHVEGVFHSEELCNGVANEAQDRAAVRFCVSMDVDKVVTDVLLWQPLTEENVDEYAGPPNW